jgi:hypothetical protein
MCKISFSDTPASNDFSSFVFSTSTTNGPRSPAAREQRWWSELFEFLYGENSARITCGLLNGSAQRGSFRFPDQCRAPASQGSFSLQRDSCCTIPPVLVLFLAWPSSLDRL